MHVLQLQSEKFKREYGILCHRFFPSPETPAVPFGSTWCVVEPGGSTSPHDHFEGETFFILEGSGTMTIDGEERKVAKGDVIYIPPFSRHVLRNGSTVENLTLLSVWWEPQAAPPESLPKRVLITSAPPTPNGALHVGHLSGPYVAADVFRRYLRLRGVDAGYLSGSDDHQSYVAAKASRQGSTPVETVNHFASSILGTLTAVDAKPDYFLRPNLSPEYLKFVQAFFARLVASGKIIQRESEALHCETCDRYLYEVYVSGGCPHCHTPTNGNGCEKCGHVNDCVNLDHPVCNTCKKPATVRRHHRFHFPLEASRAALEQYYRRVSMSAHLRALVHEALERGLPEISASHVAEWGIPCGLPGSEGQVIYEWVEMAAGYLFCAEQLGKGSAERYWKSPDTEVVQFFGFDNSFFYAAIIPALLLAYDSAIKLPVALVANEFYRLDGEKFSTSRNHAIWGDELLAEVPSDVVRFYLAYDRPENHQTNFTLEGMTAVVRHELVESWEGWLVGLEERLAVETGGTAPEFSTGYLNPTQQHFLDRLGRFLAGIAETYSARTFSLNDAARQLTGLVTATREFSRSQEYLREVPSLRPEWRNALALELAALKSLTQAATPLMPRTAVEWRRALGDESAEPHWETGASLVPAGRKLGRLSSPGFSDSLRAIERFAAAKASAKRGPNIAGGAGKELP